MTQDSSPTPGHEPTPPQPASAGRWLKVALAVSLALNLAVAGIVGGVFLRAGGRPPHAAQVRDLGFGPFSEALSASDRMALRRSFQERSPDLRDLRATLRGDVQAVLGALRADPFDPARLQTVLQSQGQRMADRLAMGQDLLAERIAAMTLQERLEFADRLESSLSRGRSDRSHDGRAQD